MEYQKDFYSDRHISTSSSASEILRVFLKIYKPKSAVDVGCGVGTWLEVLKRNGCRDVLGIDSSDVPTKYLRLKKDEFLVKNLERPFNLKKRYDLSLSLEVAEHLTSKAGRLLIKNLCSLSDVVLFSAAIPGQGGVNHINEQWQSYWQKLFFKEKYICLDLLRPQIWNNNKIYYWYRQNILVYIRKNSKRISKHLIDRSIIINPFIADVVHPESYILKSKLSKLNLIVSKVINLVSKITK